MQISAMNIQLAFSSGALEHFFDRNLHYLSKYPSNIIEFVLARYIRRGEDNGVTFNAVNITATRVADQPALEGVTAQAQEELLLGRKGLLGVAIFDELYANEKAPAPNITDGLNVLDSISQHRLKHNAHAGHTQHQFVAGNDLLYRHASRAGCGVARECVTGEQSAIGRVDIRRWVSQKVIDRTEVGAVSGTNILEISYRATTPGEAKAMADNLRNAYLDNALQSRRKEATKAADWYTQQATQEQASLNAADAAKTAYEKANGIVMQGDNSDVDTARLRALSGQGGVGGGMIAIAPPSAASIELAALDSQISQASQSLGPNHPQMQAMRARRGVVSRIAAQDASAAARAASNAAGAGAGALDAAVRAQTSRVIAKREQIERLNQLQAEVNLRREAFNKSMMRIVELRKEAGIADTGISSLGDAVTPQQPKFPNKPLVYGGSLGLGVGLGLVLSVLVEMFGRRVRSAEDLRSTLDVPLLAIIATRPTRTAASTRPSLNWLRRRRAVQA